MEFSLSQILMMSIPSILVGIIAYYFFTSYVKEEQNRRDYKLKKETAKELLPHRIQALERMALFLERIKPGSLLLRVLPDEKDKVQYTRALVSGIEEEFQHNLAQQIYISEECWEVIKASKNATIALIRKASLNEECSTGTELRAFILEELVDKPVPSETGLAYVKKEAREMW